MESVYKPSSCALVTQNSVLERGHLLISVDTLIWLNVLAKYYALVHRVYVLDMYTYIHLLHTHIDTHRHV